MLANASVKRFALSNVAPGLVGAAAAVEHQVVVAGSGLRVGDVGVFKPRQANVTGIVFNGVRVSAVDTMELSFCNPTAAGITPPATDDYDVFIFTATGSAQT